MVNDKNDMVKTRNGGISFSFSFIEEIDNTRGDISRSCFVRRAIEKYLMDKKELEQTEVVGHPIKTTHNMQDVVSPIDRRTWYGLANYSVVKHQDG